MFSLQKTHFAIAVAGILLGAVAAYGYVRVTTEDEIVAAPSAATGASSGSGTTFRTMSVSKLPTETVPAGNVQSRLATPPTGWDTSFAVRLDVKLLGQYDSRGPAAWDAAKHPLVYVTTNGAGYAGFFSGLDLPGIAIIDADTYEVILEKQFKLDGVEPKKHFEDHGVGVSPDGKWIYLPTADMNKTVSERGRLLIIDAKTLKVDKVIQPAGNPHHIKTVDYYDGKAVKNLVLVEIFNWNNPGGGPGSGIFVLDPMDDNRVAGGFRSEDVQANPYLAFPHPDGRHLFVGLPPGPIGDPDIKHHAEGWVAVIDMTTWKPVDFYMAGFDPIWTAFTADGQFAYVTDGGSDEIFKIDNVEQREVGTSRSSVHGAYGGHLNWDETKLFTVEKGEASHNRGKTLGEVDVVGMKPVDNHEMHCLRGDHGLIHPDPARNELWISYNSNFRDVVFDMEKLEIKTTINHTGSSHNGAFVKYAVVLDGSWTGEVLSDQSGLHGSARVLKEDMLGVKEIVYGATTTPVTVFR
ncbi:MAG: hypothetical protein HY556_11395 [Euryarchaeota archaeon]|nr:hypothetical protein [Euryarchaeota archaeon]